MDIVKLKQFVQEIVKKSSNLKDKYTSEEEAPVNYACIFFAKTMNNIVI